MKKIEDHGLEVSMSPELKLAQKAWLKAQLEVDRHVQWHESHAEDWPCQECRRLAAEETRTEAALHTIERINR